MTVKLLCDWDGRASGYPNAKALNLITLTAAEEADMIEQNIATATLTGGTAYVAPVANGVISSAEKVAHAAAHAAMGLSFRRRCNPIIKLKSLSQINGGASVSTAAWGTKLRVPCDFYAVRLHFFNQHANTPNWQAVIATTETAATDTATNLSQPVVGGAAKTTLDSTSNGYGWRTVTFSGGSTGTHSAGGTTYVPNILSSDVIPIQSVPRADGGSGRLLMIRASSPGAATQGFTFGSVHANMRTPTAANRGLIYQTWFGGNGAYVTAPGSNNVSALDTSGTPIIAIELFTHANGSTILVVGDSLTENSGIVADYMSSWGLRGAMDASTDTKPVGIINCGASGQNSSVFYAAGIQHLNAFKPSVAFYPIWTPNDYLTPANADDLRADIAGALARAARFIDAAEEVRTKVILWTGVPHSAAAGLTTAALDSVRTGVNALIKTYPGVIVADFDSIVSDGASPAGFVTGYSQGDGVHFNEAGIEALAVSVVADALELALR